MSEEVKDIELIILVGSSICLGLVSLLVIFLFFYQKRYFQQEKDILKIKEEASKEILKAQLEIRENTLNGVAREIHDNSGQILSLIKLNINQILNGSRTNGRSQELLLETKSLVVDAISDLRNLSRSLSSDTIEKLGFETALKNQFEKIKKSGHYKCSLIIEGKSRKLEVEKEIILFRMTQEIIQNILKHSHAVQILTMLRYEPDQFIVTIVDDGIGFNFNDTMHNPSTDKGSGLENLSSRAQLIGANLQVITHPGEGTQITIRLPYPAINN
jgi:signal transduction histidine kinase